MLTVRFLEKLVRIIREKRQLRYCSEYGRFRYCCLDMRDSVCLVSFSGEGVNRIWSFWRKQRWPSGLLCTWSVDSRVFVFDCAPAVHWLRYRFNK